MTTHDAYWVQLWHEFTPLGGGFVLTPTFVLTAAHCIRALPDGQEKLSITVPSGESYDGQLVHVDLGADLALIEVSAKGIEGVLVLDADRCRTNDTWFAPYRPSEQDPNLMGAVVHGSIDYRCEGGTIVTALQLQTVTELGDYAGYSGGPVERRLSNDDPRLVGMLIEQYYDRQNGERASNVLFAATIADILARLPQFQLHHLRAVLFEEEAAAQSALTDTAVATIPLADPSAGRITILMQRSERLLDFIRAMADSGKLDATAVAQSQLSIINRLVQDGL